MKIQVQNLGANLNVAEAMINRYLQEITLLHRNCDNEKKEKELVQGELKGQKAENSDLKAENSDLKAENQDLKAQLDVINTNFLKFRKPLTHYREATFENAVRSVSNKMSVLLSAFKYF